MMGKEPPGTTRPKVASAAAAAKEERKRRAKSEKAVEDMMEDNDLWAESRNAQLENSQEVRTKNEKGSQRSRAERRGQRVEGRRSRVNGTKRRKQTGVF